jgi:hypothetical protein
VRARGEARRLADIHGGEHLVGVRSQFLPPAGDVRPRGRGSRYEPEWPVATRRPRLIDEMQTVSPPADKTCPICLSAFVRPEGADTDEGEGPGEGPAREDKVKRTECGHHFHRHCIQAWERTSRPNPTKCPQCRHVLRD